MSEITAHGSNSAKKGIYVYIGDVGDSGNQKLEKLRDISHEFASGHDEGGIRFAVRSALNRAAVAGEAEAARAVGRDYFVNTSLFKRYTSSKKKIAETDDGADAELSFKGNLIPLILFGARYSKSGRVTVSVKRANPRASLDNAFVATTVNGTGIFERTSKKRLPIRQFYGPATTQMMNSDEAIMDAVDEKVRETYEKRLDHEIDRIMNGWGM